jgi:phosphoglycerate dehydrogenase-like enzyme
LHSKCIVHFVRVSPQDRVGRDEPRRHVVFDMYSRVVRMAVYPEGVRPFLVDAVRAGGGTVVAPAEAEGLVWTSPRDASALRALLDEHANIRWVQLPWAGIEPFLEVLDSTHLWTAGQGVYAEPVAEHALTLALAGLRDIKKRAGATSWQKPSGLSLFDGNVTLFGAGGITQVLVKLLAPFRARTTVVRRRAQPFAGASRTVTFDQRVEAVRDADVVVLACPLTRLTRHCIATEELAAMKRTAWLVNVARGGLVDTDALVATLQAGAIGGAALDVTEPEPLPDAHPLWSLALITPHVGNTPEMAVPLLSERVRENVRRYAAREPMLGVVDVEAGY